MMTLMSNMRKFMNGLELEVNLGTIEKVTSLMDFVTIAYPGDQTTGPLALQPWGSKVPLMSINSMKRNFGDTTKNIAKIHHTAVSI